VAGTCAGPCARWRGRAAYDREPLLNTLAKGPLIDVAETACAASGERLIERRACREPRRPRRSYLLTSSEGSRRRTLSREQPGHMRRALNISLLAGPDASVESACTSLPISDRNLSRSSMSK